MIWFCLLKVMFASDCSVFEIGHADSQLCKCNVTYCDYFDLEHNKGNNVSMYTTSKSGSRLAKSTIIPNRTHKLYFDSSQRIDLSGSLNQKIIGFGGAITDATLISLYSLSNKTRRLLEKSWFGTSGASFNLIRVPIGGTDFSEKGYDLDPMKDDFKLKHFNLSNIDYNQRIPLIKRWKNKNWKIFGSAWSAPLWMKSNGKYNGRTKLIEKQNVYNAWAKYLLKYTIAMSDIGVDVWGLTSQNEPSMGLFISSDWNANGFTPRQMKVWLRDHLYPVFNRALKNGILNSKPKMLLLDDQRLFIPKYVDFWLEDEFIRNNSDGIAVHWYWNHYISPNVLDTIHKKYPEKLIISSEACAGTFDKYGFENVWTQAEDYAYDIVQTLNHFTSGWVDWNLALNMRGGPNWANNFRNACVHVDSTKDEFYKAPCHYIMLHFSRFFVPGTQIIRSDLKNTVVVGKQPNGTFVGVVINLKPYSKQFNFFKAQVYNLRLKCYY